MSDAFQCLKETYFTLDVNFNDLFAACQTDDEKNMLRTDYVAARNNFLTAQNKILSDDEPMVKDLVAQIQAAQSQINNELQNLQDVASLLKVITVAVNIGSKLTSLTA